MHMSDKLQIYYVECCLSKAGRPHDQSIVDEYIGEMNVASEEGGPTLSEIPAKQTSSLNMHAL